MKENVNRLSNETEVKVRFNEVDSMGVVWHGHYVSYFEDGREAFGKQYGINYLDVREKGYTIPLVSIHCSFKKTVSYDEILTVKTTYIPSLACKIQFDYEIFNESLELVATGKTTQVFLDNHYQLVLTNPPFYNDWKKKWNLLNG